MLLVASRLQEETDQVRQSLEKGDIEQAVTQSRRVSALRLARLITDAPSAQAEQFLRTVSSRRAGRIATYLPTEFIAGLLAKLADDFAPVLLAEMAPEAIAHLMPHLDADLRERLLSQLDTDYRAQVEALAAYPAGTSGSVMSPYFLSIGPDATVAEAVEAVRHSDEVTERTAYIFIVTPETGKLPWAKPGYAISGWLCARSYPLAWSTDWCWARSSASLPTFCRAASFWGSSRGLRWASTCCWRGSWEAPSPS